MLRLMLAAMVILGHAYPLTASDGELLSRVTDGMLGFGDVGVIGFFGLSGFLLYSSVQRHTPRVFLLHRASRLLPGFWAAIVVTALVFGPLIWLIIAKPFSDFPWVGWQSSATYIASNSALVIFQHTIAGVTSSLPYPDAINGSLWSLAPEACCYLALLVVAALSRGHVRHLRISVGGVVVLLAGALLAIDYDAPGTDHVTWVLQMAMRLGLAFFLGGLVAVLVQRGLPSWVLVVVAAAGIAFAASAGAWGAVGEVAWVLLVLGVGLSIRHRRLCGVGSRNDLSYGTYLYAFPVQQLLVAAFPLIDPIVLAVVALAAVLPIAWASWAIVERPSLEWARRRTTPTLARPLS